MAVRKQEQSEIEQMFNEFQETRFYRWMDSIVTGSYRWLILPITGLIDAFLLVIPTELVLVLYMMRNQRSIWWVQTAITAFFAGIGYVLLAWIVSNFGLDAVSWLQGIAGESLTETIDTTLSEYIILFAISAGVTSIFPMPMTGFAIATGLFGWSFVGLFIGAVIGKFFRFGIFAFGTVRWGNQALELYFRHANLITAVLIALIVLYLLIQ